MTLRALQHICEQTCETAEAIVDLAHAGDSEASFLVEPVTSMSKALRTLCDSRMALTTARSLPARRRKRRPGACRRSNRHK